MGLGLLLTAFTLGVRHGFDWDHIAAISDLSGTAEDKRRGFVLSMIYALGHGAVVFVLGVAAIAFGLAIPDGFDEWMGRVVGITLITLGVWILIELLRKGRDFRLQSRWMLMISGTFAGLRKVRTAASGRTIQVEHEHTHEHGPELINSELINSELMNSDLIDGEPSPIDRTEHAGPHAHDHAHIEISADASLIDSELTAAGTGRRSLRRGVHMHRPGHSHGHAHSHKLALPDRADAAYGNGTAAGIGMLHGVGIESPTQIAIFVASTAAVGVGFGLILLGVWIVGLLVANALIAALVGAGLLHAEKSFRVYAALAVFVGVMSIALGVLYILGLDILPAILT